MTSHRSVLALALLACCAPRHDDTAREPESQMTQRPTILIATTSHDRKGDTGEPTGAYLPEIAEPYEVFVDAGYDVEFASVRGGRVPLDGVDRSVPAVARFLDDAALVARLHASIASRDVDPSRYAAIFFAGGHGAMWDLPDDVAFQRVTAAIYERGGAVAAVCHGPAALVNVRLADGRPLVAGRTVSAFTDDEERAVQLDRVVPFLLESALRERGAHLVTAPRWQPRVAVDARLVTGQNPASAAPTARALVELLATLR
ncbi:ThiJ/PfpI family protein [Sandaracinus amylolyticus]|uniref:ThiJ/PfpI family protein n=2 Tax=Sandaracinus amylolyticus TaxID=927083 RepID=A0A0F6W9V1_9BACT|nr:ThiJ/PfpI family protein [Sandaracinus amylolyticus]